jgi:DNA polymerase-3 subunit beta
LRLVFEQTGVIKISCSTSIGKFSDEVTCKTTGAAVEMGFNNKYLLDALRAAGSDEIRIEISGSLSPIRLLPPEGEDYLFLVLPVRLKNEM